MAGLGKSGTGGDRTCPAAYQRQLSSVFASPGDEGRAKRVEDRMVSGIAAGRLLDGDRLPSESELAASLGVATMTAREALVFLRARGW
ncbi:GntR family transcriptional regulator [Paeniglutamicibacter psychrophenolicus]|uniref:GntR family transcriptional regulator n=1 Tax=Paeniglutamicibacter psychrophenolicus TaxID=257454 RepID=UPI0027820A23|nr:GntR family transcriptional regulator [Paeniglutamicibacter psychrophenolicus]MDQ0092439.1 DNA-binding FadR family transcriptional regulator [Paeniglutamicibacter psychrophenolicus]